MSRAASTLALLLVAGCAPHKTPEFTPSPGVYAAPADIKFSIKITPQRFALGEPVTLEANMFNSGHGAFEKDFATGCQWDYEVASEDGRVVAPSRMCTMAGSQLRLEAGELRVIMREWKGNDDYFNAGEPLRPGRYTITAGFVDQYTHVVPMSEPVWIEIVASRKSR